ncbi:DUF3307 domain-containing protein [Streptomyces sclerotialus]|uniref:DUF3307 domain-containing protein n=1 Tax=Streptomyces sclerotialus TaxID=1957 RepID=UPI0004C4F2A9
MRHAKKAATNPLQTDHQATCKANPGRTGWAANLAHAATHVLISGLLLAIGTAALGWHLPPLPAAVAVVWIGATHSLIDRRWPIQRWMRLARQSKWAERGGAAHVDQTAHITALVVAALCLAA